MGEQVSQLGGLQGLIERNPLAFLCALLAMGLLGAVAFAVRQTLSKEKLQRLHQKQLSAMQALHEERVDSLQHAHYARIDEMQRDALERGIKLEHLVHGLVQMVRMGAIDVGPGKKRRKKPTTNPRLTLPMDPEAPTQVLEEGEPDDE